MSHRRAGSRTLRAAKRVNYALVPAARKLHLGAFMIGRGRV